MYHILIYHLLVGVFNNSKEKRKILIEVKKESAMGNVLQRYSPLNNITHEKNGSNYENSSSISHNSKNANIQRYLNTTVVFQSISNREIGSQISIEIDPSYRLMKYFAELYGGKVTASIKNEIILLQIILPLDYDIVTASIN